MDYQDTLAYLYNSVPMFQQVGGAAYKEGLENTLELDAHLGHPHRRFRTIHVAGTNGKGSCSHTLAAILQEAGYRTGLYTSPHLLDFRERIRINGKPIPQEYVVNFVARERPFFEPLHPSFFELATAMAFRYFADEAVDVAVIEVGMGGRLDCTNIIRPDLVPHHQHQPGPHAIPRTHIGTDSCRESRNHQARHPRSHRGNHTGNPSGIPAQSPRGGAPPSTLPKKRKRTNRQITPVSTLS